LERFSDPEAYGGAGLGYQTLGLVLEQLGQKFGRFSLFASSVVGAAALMHLGSDEQKQSVAAKHCQWQPMGSARAG
jgi:alkylation response protein AidB-like acyl-CoA dehydrogenase